MKNNFPKRGEIYWVNLDPVLGSEINKTRPALIVSNNIGNEMSRRIIIAPITSSMKQIYPFEVQLEINGKLCKALLDQLRSIDKMRLGNKIMAVSTDLIPQVDKALKIALALV